MGLSKLGNENLKWETLTDLNIGLDAAFFNNRLQFNIDAYRRERSDVILTKQLMSYQELLGHRLQLQGEIPQLWALTSAYTA